MTVMINAMVMRYKIAVLSEDRYKSESFFERRERVTSGVYGITHTWVICIFSASANIEHICSPRRVPLKLTRRR